MSPTLSRQPLTLAEIVDTPTTLTGARELEAQMIKALTDARGLLAWMIGDQVTGHTIACQEDMVNDLRDLVRQAGAHVMALSA